MIKTIALTGGEQEVRFAGKHQYYHFHNLGGGEVLASLTPGVTRGKDNVKIIKSGGAGYLQVDAATDTIYLAGTGEVQVEGTGNAFPPSFSGAPKGGGEITSDGEITAVTVDYSLLALNLYGKSTQDGTPTPEAPIDIVSVGDDGNVSVTACGKNLIDQNVLLNAGWTLSSDGYYKGTVENLHQAFWADGKSLIELNTNEQVTFSLTAYAVNGTINTACLMCEYSDGTTAMVPVRSDRDTIQKYILTTAAGKTVKRIGLSYENIGLAYIKDMQLEFGSTATPYEPYKGNTATISSGLPLCAVGDVRDELIYNADGTGKIIKHTALVMLDGSEDKNIIEGTGNETYTSFGVLDVPTPVSYTMNIVCSTTNVYNAQYSTVDNFAVHIGRALNINFGVKMGIGTVAEVKAWLAAHPTTIIYPLATPQEIELSAAEMAELMQLQTFDGITNIYNDEGAEMSVKVATNPLLAEYVKPVIDGITARYEARIAALEAAVTNT